MVTPDDIYFGSNGHESYSRFARGLGNQIAASLCEAWEDRSFDTFYGWHGPRHFGRLQTLDETPLTHLLRYPIRPRPRRTNFSEYVLSPHISSPAVNEREHIRINWCDVPVIDEREYNNIMLNPFLWLANDLSR